MSLDYKGDYTPSLYNAAKRYRMNAGTNSSDIGVKGGFQKDRTLLACEASEIQMASDNFVRQLIIANYTDGSSTNNGFKVEESATNTNNFIIKGGNGSVENAGVLFVDGYILFLKSDIEYTSQNSSTNLTNDAYTKTVLPALTTPVSNRQDEIYIDFYFAEVSPVTTPALASEYTDTSLLVVRHTANRLRQVQDVKVAEGSTTPINYTDANGIYHRCVKIATINRLAGNANITSSMIIDNRIHINKAQVELQNNQIIFGNMNQSTTLTYNGSGLGIGTTSALTNLDVIGTQYVSSRLGIGTIAPVAELHVEGDLVGKSDNTSSLGSSSRRYAKLYMASTIDYASDLRFNSNTEKMRLTTSGNLGIGTNPVHALHIIGDSYIQGNQTIIGDLLVNGTTTTMNSSITNYDELTVNSASLLGSALKVIQTNFAATGAVLDINNSGTGNALIIDKGNVGIGSISPQKAVVISDGTVEIAIDHTATAAEFGTYSNHQLAIMTNGNARITISASGSVNIPGVNNVGSKLVISNAAGLLSSLAVNSNEVILSNDGINITSGLISDANVSAGAAIAWSKINSTGVSFQQPLLVSGAPLTITGGVSQTLTFNYDSTLATSGNNLYVVNDGHTHNTQYTPIDHAVNASTYGYGDAILAGHLRVGGGLSVLTGTISIGGYSTLSQYGITDAATSTDLSTHAGLTTSAHGGIVASNDSRLSDSRDPIAHAVNASTYGYGDTVLAGHLRVGGALSVSGGTVSITFGNIANTACEGNDSRLSDQRIPLPPIYYNAGNVGIGSSVPTKALVVADGNVNIITDHTGVGAAAIGAIGTDSNHDFIIKTNATEKIRIHKTGNVGIGTAIMANILHIARSAITPTDIVVENKANTGASASRIYLGAFAALEGFDPHSYGTSLLIGVYGDQNTVNIDERGNYAPAGGVVFTSSGFGSMNFNSMGDNLYSANAANASINFLSKNVKLMTISNSGFVGIGSSVPTKALVISDKNVNINIDHSGDGLKALGSIGTDSNHDFVFNTNATEKMRITSAGNVGIGSSVPTKALVVADGNVNIITDHTGVGAAAIGSIGTDSFHDLTFNTGSTEKMRISSTGKVGIGSSVPTKALVVSDNNVNIFTDHTGTGATAIGSFGTDSFHDLTFNTGSTEKMRITSAGNVVIGTTATSKNFEVVSMSSISAGITSKSILGSSNFIIDGTLQGNGNGDLIFPTAADISRCYLGFSGTKDLNVSTFLGAIGYCNYGNQYSPYYDGIGITFTSTTTPAKFFFGKSGNFGLGITNPITPISALSGATLTTGGVWTDASDRKYKINITDLEKYGLKEILQLKPVTYTHKDDTNNKVQIGLIAQDVLEILPEVVEGKEGSYGLSYGRIVPVLVNAIKELDAQNKSLLSRLEQIENLLKEKA